MHKKHVREKQSKFEECLGFLHRRVVNFSYLYRKTVYNNGNSYVIVPFTSNLKSNEILYCLPTSKKNCRKFIVNYWKLQNIWGLPAALPHNLTNPFKNRQNYLHKKLK